MKRALLLVLLASGCDRCRGEPVPISVRPAYDARPPRDPNAPPTWTPAGSILAPEAGARARGYALPFGRLLLWKKQPELFDSHTGIWKKTSPRPACADVVGGYEELARIPDEIVFAVGATCGYDAEHDTWVKVPAFDVHGGGWSVTQLAKGHILVTGGGDASAPRKQAFRWDCDSKEIVPLELLEPRTAHSALRLLDDTVLITAAHEGGVGATMELFVPSTGTFRKLGAQEHDGDAVLLEDGRVAFVAKDKCGLYDPSNASWLECPAMNTIRVPHTFTITAIRDDRILVVGGRAEKDPGTALSLVEVYDPHDGVWIDAAPMPSARADHTAAQLLDGRVVIASGTGNGGPIAEAYYYTPDPPPLPPPMLPTLEGDPADGSTDATGD